MDIVTIFTALAISAAISYLVITFFRSRNDENSGVQVEKNPAILKLIYGTQSGTARRFCFKLANKAKQVNLKHEVISIENYDPEDNLHLDALSGRFCIFCISTYTDGEPSDDARWFCKWLTEGAHDFRVGKSMLKGLKYAVFGLGNSLYEDNYNVVAKTVDRCLHKLGATRCYPLGEGDANVAREAEGTQESDFETWACAVLDVVSEIEKCGVKGVVKKGSTAECSKEENCECKQDEELVESTSEEDDDGSDTETVLDVEDIGSKLKNSDSKEKVVIKRKSKASREMITPSLRQALTKQGYRLVGTHSGVKLCRWTKSMLRGRGGCYKHTFYGIESHRCMETTPSLACANKCVFCWRHHTNPVGTEWKWKMDEPEMIVKQAIENHYGMIKQFKGVPGVQPEKFAEGFSIKHCALSLVGEPIMYPKINEFVCMLHDKGISSFLVTNAQFPEAISNLVPVTQLYVSVDAATPESLKKIDRPLFKDYWPRFIDSLKALGEKGQRTVYRLTIVKAWNNEEIESYVNLVQYGKPDFIEVKGVTYCGDISTAGGLTMKNVPWHEEILHFVSLLTEMLPDYGVACEHEHSNCVLIADKKFKINDKWNTWIDYSRFHELYQEYRGTGAAFTALDYVSETPSWAVIGSKERGFDPAETRWRRKSNKIQSGC